MNYHYEPTPAYDVTVKDKFDKPFTVHFPESQSLIAPALGIVHGWLWDIPFYYSWRDGFLCPFADNIQRKNITCSAGRRAHCSGNGILVGPNHIRHLSPREQHRYGGRVICYEWCHRLGDTYWNIPTDELLNLPDDPRLVSILVLRRVLRESRWTVWVRETGKRKHTSRNWLPHLDRR